MPDNGSPNLNSIARNAMISRGLLPDFSKEDEQEAKAISAPAACTKDPSVRDLRKWLWFSIDNDDSRDLDQLTYAEHDPSTGVDKIYIAIADVDALVKAGSAIDQHAQKNTTSVYTPTKIFPMLPEK